MKKQIRKKTIRSHRLFPRIAAVCGMAVILVFPVTSVTSGRAAKAGQPAEPSITAPLPSAMPTPEILPHDDDPHKVIIK